MPCTKEELLKLPGIGPYTAGAIASIANGQRVSAVDGNVIRVFSRLYNIFEDVTKTSVKKQIEELVDESLPSKEEIYAKMLGCINSPASGIANSVNAVMSSLVRAVAAVRDQKSA